MTTRRGFAVFVAVVASFTMFPAPAGAQDPTSPTDPSNTAGMTGAEVSTMFGVAGELDTFDSSGAGLFIDSGMTLADVDPASGALMGADVAAQLTDQMAILDDLAQANELNRQALEAAERARADAQRRRGGRLPASVPYADEFEAAGERHQVDPALLAAVAQVESSFRDDIVFCSRKSSKGAMGIMQFMPGTAATYGIDPCNPSEAIDGGARYLADLFRQWGDWDHALASYNAGPTNVRNRGVEPWRGYVNKVRAAWDSYSAMRAEGGEAGQGEVGPEGCPKGSAPNTMRRGSESIGVYELCKRSIAAARTPAAARAIQAALGAEFLGKPYSQPKRNQPGWYDCSSYVTRAYTVTGTPLVKGWPPTTASLTSGYSWTQRVAYSDAKPGDLVLSRAPGHVGMLLSDGYWVHTNRTGDISHVTRAPANPPLTLAVLPDRV